MTTTRSVFATSAGLLLTFSISTAEAEFVGLNLSSSQWQPAQSKPFNYADDLGIDLVDDLDRANPQQSSMAIILEHPFRALPNVRYSGYSLDATDASYGPTGSGSSSVDPALTSQSGSSFDLTGDDIVLYYQLIDRWIDLDMGVDLKRLDGEVLLNGSSESESIDETIPLLHFSARLSLPMNGFYVGADISTNLIDLGLTNSRAQDSTIMLGYESGKGLGVEGGYKYFSLDLDDIETLDNNIEYDGLFLNGYYHF